MLAAVSLLQSGSGERDLYLYDTFDWSWENPSEYDGFLRPQRTPGPTDARHRDDLKYGEGEKAARQGVSASEVTQRLLELHYPADRIFCIPGRVQSTLPSAAPEEISLLRLDTDYYESTLHELECLFPRLVPGGVLIIDDYGKLSGATRAVDEYFERNDIDMLLSRVDIQGRVGVKAGRCPTRSREVSGGSGLPGRFDAPPRTDGTSSDRG